MNDATQEEEPAPICPVCQRPYERYKHCWIPHEQCHCLDYAIPIADDGTALMPDGRKVKAP